ncbi:Guanine nucleotide binding protein (G protein), beta polypeptide 1-like [Physocladia obscura]|uniref:ASTRA-associated protein 1 n=1 Tax=Physocladia obscura TaxID=109957 RepID=A0AAD5XDQ0_9FUNG|nr:Guanine nucleotide binding protein (G protein), beta polypeptide 1-like [Physocladia obscura]
MEVERAPREIFTLRTGIANIANATTGVVPSNRVSAVTLFSVEGNNSNSKYRNFTSSATASNLAFPDAHFAAVGIGLYVSIYSLQSFRLRLVLDASLSDDPSTETHMPRQHSQTQDKLHVVAIIYSAPLLLVHTNNYSLAIFNLQKLLATLNPSQPAKPFHVVPVNSLNFCRPCVLGCSSVISLTGRQSPIAIEADAPATASLLFATTSICQDSDRIDVLDLFSMEFCVKNLTPSTAIPHCRLATVVPVPIKTGMLMCLHLFKSSEFGYCDKVLLAAGYESGDLVLYSIFHHENDQDFGRKRQPNGGHAHVIWSFKAFENPVTSFDVYPNAKYIIVGAAEESIVQVRIFNASKKNKSSHNSNNENDSKNEKLLIVEPKYIRIELPVGSKGCTEVKVRHDSKLVAVACWDSMVRLYSAKTMIWLGILGSEVHRHGVTCIAFAPISELKKSREQTGLQVVSKAEKSYGLKTDTMPENMVAVGTEDGRVVLWCVY